MDELTDEQIKQEDAFLKGMPPLNIGALFLPPIWGPAHGMWATILFYPIWLLADNAFYAAFVQRNALSYIIAAIIFITLTAGTFVFARLAQPFAAHRAVAGGKSKKDYLRAERVWAVVCVVFGSAALVAATYYNVVIRPTLGA
ncbi:MAG: viscotoxin-A3 [Raoultibacter sp.]